MKKIFIAVALLAASPVLAQTPQPADWTTITLTANLNKGADAAWDKIGGNDWCAIAKYLDVKGCTINSGKGELGSVRTIATATGSVVEIVVARTAHSYTYAQPFTPIFYHGTLAVEPLDRGRQTKIVYSLFYDQAPLGTDQAKAENRASRTKRFNEALDNMKAMAEAQ